jgi:hypothetical protein
MMRAQFGGEQHMKSLVEQLTAARRVSTPLIEIKTADNASAQSQVAKVVGDDPLVSWDCMNGFRGVNAKGIALVKKLIGDKKASQVSGALVDALDLAQQFPEDSTLVAHNVHLFWKKEHVLQGTWNLRDPMKTRGAMYVQLTTRGSTTPAELADDVFTITEELPSTGAIGALVDLLASSAKAKLPKEVRDRAIDAALGLPAFPAEQSIAMHLDAKTGTLHVPGIWERKASAVEQKRGVAVSRDTHKLKDVIGVDNAVAFLKRYIEHVRPGAIMYCDELEKAMAGVGSDLSGVSDKSYGKLLTWMQQRHVKGTLFLGQAGTGKTYLGTAVGNEIDVPTILFDFAAMESGIIGSSMENLTAGLDVVDAIGQGKVLLIGSANSDDKFTPALLRRFSLPKFYFDFPTAPARRQLWDTYMTKNGLKKQALPDDNDWTGAEISECCEIAAAIDCPILEAAMYILPTAITSAEEVETLRRHASGRYISAAEPGFYNYVTAEERAASEAAEPPKRRIRA